jgi:hypothetical protein
LAQDIGAESNGREDIYRNAGLMAGLAKDLILDEIPHIKPQDGPSSIVGMEDSYAQLLPSPKSGRDFVGATSSTIDIFSVIACTERAAPASGPRQLQTVQLP